MRIGAVIAAALQPVLADLRATGGPLPRLEPSDWQRWPARAQSVMLYADGGSGLGVWVDPALTEVERVAMVADQVQEWVVGELWSQGASTSWPVCPDHPRHHPMSPQARDGAATWCCPMSRRPVVAIGRLDALAKN